MIALLMTLLLGAQDGLTDADCRKLHDSLKPPTAELWRDIPWKVSLVEAQQAGAEKRPGTQIEGRTHRGVGEPAGFRLALGRRQALQVDGRQAELQLRHDELNRPAVRLAERGPQRLVPLDELLKRLL